MRKSPYLLNNFRNFNEIFKIDMAYDDINSDKKAEFHFLSLSFSLSLSLSLSRKHIFGKTTGGEWGWVLGGSN